VNIDYAFKMYEVLKAKNFKFDWFPEKGVTHQFSPNAMFKMVKFCKKNILKQEARLKAKNI
jgi:hypothetical protein